MTDMRPKEVKLLSMVIHDHTILRTEYLVTLDCRYGVL